MKASELRIGNIVSSINRSAEVHLPVYIYPFRVFSVNPFDVRMYKYDKNPAILPDSEMQDFDINDICGIPLTEEWLVKFGITETNNLECSEFSIGVCDGDLYLYPKIEGSIRLNTQYVHQLQNLYFALTGEELTIKAGQSAQSPA